MRQLLAKNLHPVAIINEAIIPEIELNGQALQMGNFPVGDLPQFILKLQTLMEELAQALLSAGVFLHFRVGRARDDAFDLWGSEIAGAFASAGFPTTRSSELNHCELLSPSKTVRDPRILAVFFGEQPVIQGESGAVGCG